MAIEKEYNIALDIVNKLKFSPMEFVHGDTLNKISFTITNNGQKINLKCYSYKIIVCRPDGIVVQNIPTVIDGENKLVYDIGTTETEKYGVVNAAVEIYDGLERITTKNFSFTVIKSLNSTSNIDSSTEYPANSNYTHTQLVPSAKWLIRHSLNKKCSVTVVDSADNVVIGDVQYTDINNIQITFQAAFAGKAYLN